MPLDAIAAVAVEALLRHPALPHVALPALVLLRCVLSLRLTPLPLPVPASVLVPIVNVALGTHCHPQGSRILVHALRLMLEVVDLEGLLVTPSEVRPHWHTPPRGVVLLWA